MDSKERQQLLAQFRALDNNERNKMLKKAGELRKRQQSMAVGHPTSRRQVDFDDEFEERPPVQRRPPSLEDVLVKLIQEESRVATIAPKDGESGIVIHLDKGLAEVVIGGEARRCALADEIAKRQQTLIAVGDEVLVAPFADGSRVVFVKPRRTRLSRIDPDVDLERVIVANVDVVGIVVSVVAPPFHPRFIDRLLLACGKGGIEPVIVLNKCDLLTDDNRDEELRKLAPYLAIEIPIVEVSAGEGIGMERLGAVLQGKLAAFVGHSGVGKSSLLNALKPDLGLDTAGLMKGYGRGQHTTTSSTLWDLGNGTRIIDTPGVRSFGLWKMSASEIGQYFPEFEGLTCRFRNCSHTHEPGCAVRNAVETGRVAAERFDTYQRLMGNG